MAIDAITLSISGMTSPVANNATATLTATAVTKLAGVDTDATRVEFELLYSPLTTAEGQGAIKPVILKTQDSSASPTGTYSATFAAALFANPGLYQVRAKGIVGAGSPEVISNFVTAISGEIKVTEAAPQTLDDLKSYLTTSDAAQTRWKSLTLTGAQIKAATGVNTNATKNVVLGTLPSGSILVGGSLNVSVADAGTATTTTATMGAESTTFVELMAATTLRATGETDVSTSFVANAAGSTNLTSIIAVTGSGKTVADIDDAMTATFSWGYVVPQTVALGG